MMTTNDKEDTSIFFFAISRSHTERNEGFQALLKVHLSRLTQFTIQCKNGHTNYRHREKEREREKTKCS